MEACAHLDSGADTDTDTLYLEDLTRRHRKADLELLEAANLELATFKQHLPTETEAREDTACASVIRTWCNVD